MNPPKILLFSRDPGGANTLIPLVELLIKRGYKIKLFGKDFALKRYELFGLTGTDILSEIKTINFENVFDFVCKESPDFILTGTSADDFTEKFLWKSAERLNIPSFAILDNWMNYGIRFSEYILAELDQYQINRVHKFLPAKICVMDNMAKHAMLCDGIDPSKILVTGQPYFDLLFKRQKKFMNNDGEILRRSLMKGSDFLITYVSEPISLAYKNNYGLGYTEKTIFMKLFNALAEIVLLEGKKFTVVIKLHPKERLNSYDEILNQCKNSMISVILDKECDSWDLVLSSDLVCGMVSILLLEALIFKKKVLSIQIGLDKENFFVLDKLEILKSILSFDDLVFSLKSIIIDTSIVPHNFETIKDAAENVVFEMEKYLKDCQNESRKDNCKKII